MFLRRFNHLAIPLLFLILIEKDNYMVEGLLLKSLFSIINTILPSLLIFSDFSTLLLFSIQLYNCIWDVEMFQTYDLKIEFY